jgi:hypothetical protein
VQRVEERPRPRDLLGVSCGSVTGMGVFGRDGDNARGAWYASVEAVR